MSTHTGRMGSHEVQKVNKCSELIGMEVKNPQGEKLGKIYDVVLDFSKDRIAYVDAQLSYAAARDLAPPYRKALWGERVELMNALVQVRFAQTQGF